MSAEQIIELTRTEVMVTGLELKDGLTHVRLSEMGSVADDPNEFRIVLGSGSRVSIGDRYWLSVSAEN